MSTPTKTAIGYMTGAKGSGRESERRQARSDPDSPQTCCGAPMMSRFAHAHDRLGQTVFVAVWHCPVCNRTVF